MKKTEIFEIIEVSQNYKLSKKFIETCIEKEWIIPCDCDNDLLDLEDISRIQLINDLMNDFGVNDEAVTIILHLIDQIHSLQGQIKRFLQANEDLR
ncbi:MAG: chaperone modulator CbpM [Spirochaetota bacterium]|nr:chaperone modulator CbpM [Spirochaetota bacterium]